MTRVALICMPWAMVRSPSIAMGICQSVASKAGIATRSHSFHVAFEEFLLGLPPQRGRLTLEEYAAVCSVLQNVGGGDWPFIMERSRARDEAFFTLLRGHSDEARRLLPKLRRTREAVPEFLECCADEVLAWEPAVVGFTTVYSQTWPNAALARVLKERQPGLRVVFGGASCEGVMGKAVLEALPWIDAIARGEAENILAPLFEALANDGDLGQIPGVCYRGPSGEVLESKALGTSVKMDDVPVPDYFEYFERLATCPRLASSVEVQLPVEFSRGCWWGAKKHCTFCGLNGQSMTPRNKSPEVAYDMTVELCQRHRVHDLTATDNILPLAYFDTLLPRLASEEIDLSLFFEVKANMTREHVALLRSSGVRTIQPGIESLSTPVLELMQKGSNAIHNARLLKWSAEYAISVIWNLLYGFPGETRSLRHESRFDRRRASGSGQGKVSTTWLDTIWGIDLTQRWVRGSVSSGSPPVTQTPSEHYEEMAAMIPSLVHFAPPNLSEVMLYRFSPYFDRPAEFGLRVDRPLPYYGLLYDLKGDSLWDLAQAFEHSYLDGRTPDAFLGSVREEVQRWQRDSVRNFRGLTYRRGPGFLTLVDTRTTTANGRGALRYKLDEVQARAYLACDAGTSASSVASQLDVSLAEIEEMFSEFIEERLMLRSGQRYLSLALPNS